jgi:microcystin-dependent protein
MEGYYGEIRMFCGDYAPRNWMLCEGQILDIAQHSPLYALLGATFGGNGTTTFGLPDLRGRCAIGIGQGPGLSHYRWGQQVGFELSQLTNASMPAHAHEAMPNLTGKIRCNDQASDHESPVGNTLAVYKEQKNAYNTQEPDADMHDNTVKVQGTIQLSDAGGSQPHPNMQPSLGINYIICTQGEWPPRPS